MVVPLQTSSENNTLSASKEMGLNFVQYVWSELRNPIDIYSSLRPLLFVCLVSGIAPFKLVGDPGNRHLVVTIFGLVLSLFHLACFCGCNLRILSDEALEAYLFSSKVSRFGENLQLVAPFAAIGLTLLLCVLKRNTLRKLLHLLSQIDKKLHNVGVKINHKYMSKFVWILVIVKWTVLVIVIYSASVLTKSFDKSPDLILWFFMFLPFVIVMTQKALFFCILRLIRDRFGFINTTLKDLHVNVDEKQLNGVLLRGKLNDVMINRFGEITYNVEKMSVDSKRKNYKVIAELCGTHEILCDACNLTEEYFTHQLLTMVTIEFVMSVFNLYFLIEVAIARIPLPGANQRELYTYFALFGGVTIGTLFGLLRTADSVTKEVSSNGKDWRNQSILLIAFNFRMKSAQSMSTKC